jgi:hypothetical protein
MPESDDEIERGISRGIEDLEHGRVKDIGGASTAARLALFKARARGRPAEKPSLPRKGDD